jgi:hypothetical protein
MKFAGFVAFFICQLANAQTNLFPVLVCSNATYTNATIETVTGKRGADGSHEWRFEKMAMPEPVADPAEQSDEDSNGLVVEWPVIETAHFRFRFTPLLHLDNEAVNGYIDRHEAAYETINEFFQARLPKKIDLFVWSSNQEAQRAGVGVLGFAKPRMPLIHQRYEETPATK